MNKQKTIAEYIMMFGGTVLVGLAYACFFVPQNIAPGGIGGLSVIVNYFIPLKVGTLTILMNIPIFVFAAKTLGRRFILKTSILLVVMSGIINFFPAVAELEDKFLSVVCGGILLGTGLGLVIYTGSSTGGTDTLAVTLNRLRPEMKTGEILLLLDAVIVILAGLVFGIETSIYSAVAVLISTALVDLIRDGINSSRAVYIITQKPEEIKQRLYAETERGVTEIFAEGGFTQRKIRILLCIVSKRQLALVKKCIKNTDSGSFVFSTSVNEVIGKGFNYFD